MEAVAGWHGQGKAPQRVFRYRNAFVDLKRPSAGGLVCRKQPLLIDTSTDSKLSPGQCSTCSEGSAPGSAGASLGSAGLCCCWHLPTFPHRSSKRGFRPAQAVGFFCRVWSGLPSAGSLAVWAPALIVKEAFSGYSSPSLAFLLCPLVPSRELLSEIKALRHSKCWRETICRRHGLGFGLVLTFLV